MPKSLAPRTRCFPHGRTDAPRTAWAVAAIIGLPSLVTCTEGGLDRRGALQTGAIPTDAGDPPALADPQPPFWTLPPGSRYFERDGIRAPILMRNISAPSAAAFRPLLRAAVDAGTTVVRVQITQGFGYQTLGMLRGGGVQPGWASEWDAVFDEAARQGLGVIVVFSLWGDWNDGTPALGWSHFDANPLSRGLGGPAQSPADLFADTEARRLWLDWVSELVRRWSSRPNVIAWEIFSELDLATGATEQGAVELLEHAHELIRGIEPWRPTFASTSDLPLLNGLPWQSLWSSPANAIVSIHPYAEDLDVSLVARVQSVWSSTPLPVLVAESGLSAAAPDGTTLTSGARADAGLGHAIWAALGSGSMSARAFYWEDGYAAYYPQTGLPLVARYAELEREAARWLAGKDFDGLAPASVTGDPPLFGASLVGATRVLGWARNELLVPPEWSGESLSRARVRVGLSPNAPDADWTVALTDPATGARSEVTGSSSAEVLSFDVEGPLAGVAFEAVRGALTSGTWPASACPAITGGACVGPAYGLELDGVSLLEDPACPSAVVYLTFIECLGRLNLVLSSCAGLGKASRVSCVELDVGDIRNQGGGSGTYYDANGMAFEMVVNEIDVPLDGLESEAIRAGVLRGTINAGDAGTREVELGFSGCSRPVGICLR